MNEIFKIRGLIIFVDIGNPWLISIINGKVVFFRHIISNEIGVKPLRMTLYIGTLPRRSQGGIVVIV